MAGKHMQQNKGSKKPVIIVVSIVAALAVIGVAAFFIINFFNNQNNTKKAPQTTTAAVTTVAPQTDATAASGGNEGQGSSDPSDGDSSATEQPAESVHVEPTTLDINIPTEEGSEITHFSASYAPNGVVEDLATGESVTLNDVFGSTYPGGTLTFNEDGSFIDTIGGSGVDSGQYNVENKEIKATYVYDRNMDITVMEWNDDGTPASFYIIYGSDGNGYRVYFSES